MKRINGWMAVASVITCSVALGADTQIPPAPPMPEPVPGPVANAQSPDVPEEPSLAEQVMPQLLRALLESGPSTVELKTDRLRIDIVVDEEEKQIARDLISQAQKLHFDPAAIRDADGEISGVRLLEQVRRSLLTVRGWQSVTDPDVAVMLNLSAEQREIISRLRENNRREARELRRQMRRADVPYGERKNRLEDFDFRLEDDIRAVLSDEQQSIFESILARARGEQPVNDDDLSVPRIDLGTPAEVPADPQP